jgi:hypothetical protein
MNFRPRTKDEPEINLIPFIDVLLVVLIFLMLSTTYSKFTEMQLKLPVADTETQRDYPKEMIVAISADGNYSINRVPVGGRAIDNVAGHGRRGQGGQRHCGGNQRGCQRAPPSCYHGHGGGTPGWAQPNHVCDAILCAGR